MFIQYFEFHVPGLQKAEFPLPDQKKSLVGAPGDKLFSIY
jgi:hypothetical protein